MKIFLVLNENSYENPDRVKGFIKLSDAENYQKELEILTFGQIDIIIKEIEVNM